VSSNLTLQRFNASLLRLIFLGTGLPEQEDISIGRLTVLLGASRANTVAGIIVDAEENGLARTAGRLQARSHLADMEWSNAWIGDARSEQDGRIRSPVFHSLIAIDAFERAITQLFAYNSPLRLLAETILFSYIAQRIRPTNAGDNRGK